MSFVLAFSLINAFDLFIYARYLSLFAGKRKAKTETTVLLIFIMAMVEAIINLHKNKYLNLIVFAIILWMFLLQYSTAAKNKAVAVILYMGMAAVAEPIGYFLYKVLICQFDENGMIYYYFTALFFEFLRVCFVEIIYRMRGKEKWKISVLPKEIIYLLVGISIASLSGCFLAIEIASKNSSADIIILCMIVVFIIL